MDLPTLVVIALAVLLVVGYFGGGFLNRSRRAGLVGALAAAFHGDEKARIQGLGRNAFRLELPKPLPGADRLVATVALAPREATLVWLLWALRGRGDLIDVKLDVARSPSGAGLVLDPRERLGRAAEQAVVDRQGHVGPAAEPPLRIGAYDESGPGYMARLLPLAASAGRVIILEVKGAQPRLELLVSVRGSPGAVAEGLSSALSRLVTALSA